MTSVVHFKQFSLKLKSRLHEASMHVTRLVTACMSSEAQVWNRTLISKLEFTRDWRDGLKGSRRLWDSISDRFSNGPTRRGSAISMLVLAASPNSAAGRHQGCHTCCGARHHGLYQFRDPTCRLAEEPCERSGMASGSRLRWQKGPGRCSGNTACMLWA